MYAYIEEGVVKEYRENLPKKWRLNDGRETGNFDSLSLDLIVSNGWYPVEDNDISIDSRIEKKNVSSITIENQKVIRNWSKEDIPIADLINQKISDIKNLLTLKLTDNVITSLGYNFLYNTDLVSNVSQLQAATVPQQGVIIGQIDPPLIEFPSPFSWTSISGVEVPMTKEDFMVFAKDVTNFKLNLYLVAKTKIAMVSQLTDALSIVNFDIESGW